MREMFIIMAILCVTCLGLFLTIKFFRGGIYGLLTRALTSVAYMLAGLIALAFAQQVMTGVLICAGLLCGLISDIFCELEEINVENKETFLNSYMLAKGIGLILYFSALLKIAIEAKIALLLPLLLPAIVGLLVAIMTLLSNKLNKIEIKKLMYQNAILSFVLSFTFGVAIALSIVLKSSRLFLFAIGIGFLMISMALEYIQRTWKKDNKIMKITTLGLSYLGQIVISLMLFFII